MDDSATFARVAFATTQLQENSEFCRVPLHRKANIVCGSKWSWPIWRLTTLAFVTSLCPNRQSADGRGTWPGAEKLLMEE